MDTLSTLKSQIKAAALSRIARRRIMVRLDRPTVSFTFDDVPHSAIQNGLPVLRALGVSATFYVAAGLGSADGCLTADDTRRLVSDGFDVGCHTYSHYRLSDGSADGLQSDAARNRAAFETSLHIPPARDFSFPFGEVSVDAKRRLARSYATLRTSYAGVNAGTCDATMLRANPIYSESLRMERVRQLCEETVAAHGWLIFYTHGVEDHPDRWGCTASELEQVIRTCLDCDLDVRTVRSVSEELLPDFLA